MLEAKNKAAIRHLLEEFYNNDRLARHSGKERPEIADAFGVLCQLGVLERPCGVRLSAHSSKARTIVHP